MHFLIVKLLLRASVSPPYSFLVTIQQCLLFASLGCTLSGADEVSGVISGMPHSHALTFGHLDASGRHQPWGLVLSSKRNRAAWSAAGRAYGICLDWIIAHLADLEDIFHREWESINMKTFAETLPFQRTPHPSVPCTPKVFHTQNFDTWKVTFAFHPSNDEDKSLCAFCHGDDDIVRFELIRDGGTAIDAFFNYWPMIFQKQRSVMCHHHDAAIFNDKGAKKLQVFIKSTRRRRIDICILNGGVHMSSALQAYWDAEEQRSRTYKPKNLFFQHLWTALIGGMYDAWSHTSSTLCRDTFIAATIDGLLAIGLAHIATYVRERYVDRVDRLGKMTRSELINANGQIHNGANEGGTNKRVRAALGMCRRLHLM